MRPKNQKARLIGLARTLSKAGYCSRSTAAKYISDGRVAVNSVIRTDPEFPVAQGDRISVDGNPVHASAFVYLAMNKPRGLVTTAADEKNRPTVYSLVDSSLPWVAPVGRLDRASEGLLLLTNDSEWAAAISSPASHLSKTYHVQVATLPSPELITRLLSGVTEQGEMLRVSSAALLRQGAKNSWFEIVLTEGRNRHIRRMFSALGIEVLRLVRISIGPLVLGDLQKGSVRRLTNDEKLALDAALDARQSVVESRRPS